MVNFEKIASAVAAATTREILKVAGTPGYGAAPAAPAAPAQGAQQLSGPPLPQEGKDVNGKPNGEVDTDQLAAWLNANGAPNLAGVVKGAPIGSEPVKTDIATLQKEWAIVKPKLPANLQAIIRGAVKNGTNPQVSLARQRYESAIKVAKEAYDSVMRSYGYDSAPEMQKTASVKKDSSDSVKSLLKGAENLVKRHKL